MEIVDCIYIHIIPILLRSDLRFLSPGRLLQPYPRQESTPFIFIKRYEIIWNCIDNESKDEIKTGLNKIRGVMDV